MTSLASARSSPCSLATTSPTSWSTFGALLWAGKMQLTNVRFRDNGQLMNVCQRIVSQVGRRVDEASPEYPTRASSTLASTSSRRLSHRRGRTAAIRQEGQAHARSARPFRHDLARRAEIILKIIGRVRCNVIISGGTGSGKTTLLNCLTNFINTDKRVITCEDAAELQLQQPHVVRLETRPPISRA